MVAQPVSESIARRAGRPLKGAERRKAIRVRIEPGVIKRMHHVVKHHGDRLQVRSIADVIDRAVQVWLSDVDP